jgi:glutaredoxin
VAAREWRAALLRDDNRVVRCSRHSLACGPDGLCVLCRKQGSTSTASGPGALLLALGACALLVTGGAFAYRGATARGPAPSPAASDLAATASPIAPAAAPSTFAGSSDVASPNAVARQQALRAFEEHLAAGSSAPPPVETAPPPPVEAPPPAAVAEPPARESPLSIDGVRIVVYTASWCSVCRHAKAWMGSRGIAYEEHDIEASRDDARALRLLNPRGSIPTFDVEGDVLVGFSERSLMDTLQRAARRRAARAY